MRKLLLILLCLSATHLSAQWLYEISGKDSAEPSYILATNRLADIQFIDSIPAVYKAYGKCHTVITEMALYDYELERMLSQAALLPDSINMHQWYTVEQYAQISEALSLTLNLTLDKLSRMQPAYITALYRQELLRRWLTYDENRSMEYFFQAVARQQDKPVISLDDAAESIYMTFNREPLHWQFSELLHITEYPEREVKLEKALLQYYKRGKLNEIVYQVCMPDNLSTISYSDYQVYARRNLNWVQRLQPYLKEGGYFICLDALYLASDDGLLARLKAAGYKVRIYHDR